MTTAVAGVTLRRARADDAEGCAAVMNDEAVYPGVLQLPYTDAAFWRQRLATELGGPAANDVHLVALHDGQVIAVGGVHPTGIAVRRRHVGAIGMGVRGDWQGRGVGGLLMTAMCEHADRWLALLRLELTVYTDNAPALR